MVNQLWFDGRRVSWDWFAAVDGVSFLPVFFLNVVVMLSGLLSIEARSLHCRKIIILVLRVFDVLPIHTKYH